MEAHQSPPILSYLFLLLILCLSMSAGSAFGQWEGSDSDIFYDGANAALVPTLPIKPLT
jgi:hypothetical protein